MYSQTCLTDQPYKQGNCLRRAKFQGPVEYFRKVSYFIVL